MAEKNIKKNEVKNVEVTSNNLQSKSLLVAIIIVVVFILGVLLFLKLKQSQQEELYSTSYLISSGTISLEIKDLDEVSQILTEAPSEFFVLISYTGTEETYELESGIKDIIDEYSLNDSFYYLNIDSIKDSDNYLTRLNTTFDTDLITTVPIILYYQNGEILDVVLRDDEMTITSADFQKLLDMYYE